MNIVGYIVTDIELKGIPNNFTILKMEDFLKNPADYTKLPTLIVGWDLVKNNIAEVSILRKKIRDNLYWTFSEIEKRTIFEKHLERFIKKSYDDYVKKIKYLNIDPIIYKINTTEELVEKIQHFAGSFAYLFMNKIVYVYYNFTIISIDLEQLDFVGLDRNIILGTLKEYTTFSAEDELKTFKNELKYLKIKYLPYLIYKNATENITPCLIPQS